MMQREQAGVANVRLPGAALGGAIRQPPRLPRYNLSPARGSTRDQAYVSLEPGWAAQA